MSWTSIKKEYVQGDIGYRPLAEKHKVSFNTLKGRAKREQKMEDAKKQRNSCPRRPQLFLDLPYLVGKHCVHDLMAA